MMYFINLQVDEPFGIQTDDLVRSISSRDYWLHIEENLNHFWVDALKITREELADDLLDKLYVHFKKNFQIFKIDKNLSKQRKIM